jgi:hypothetical protein
MAEPGAVPGGSKVRQGILASRSLSSGSASSSSCCGSLMALLMIADLSCGWCPLDWSGKAAVYRGELLVWQFVALH